MKCWLRAGSRLEKPARSVRACMLEVSRDAVERAAARAHTGCSRSADFSVASFPAPLSSSTSAGRIAWKRGHSCTIGLVHCIEPSGASQNCLKPSLLLLDGVGLEEGGELRPRRRVDVRRRRRRRAVADGRRRRGLEVALEWRLAERAAGRGDRRRGRLRRAVVRRRVRRVGDVGRVRRLPLGLARGDVEEVAPLVVVVVALAPGDGAQIVVVEGRVAQQAPVGEGPRARRRGRGAGGRPLRRSPAKRQNA